LTFFIDANVLIYGAVPSDYRAPCLEILEAIADGRADGHASTAALEEVWYVELSGKAGNLDGLTRRAYLLLAPLLPVTDEAFRLALNLDAPQLGPNDRLHVGTCMVHELDVVVSADQGFDGLRGIQRVDPLDTRGRRGLLATAEGGRDRAGE
jgi:predicted nucleic acid-binding protein